MISTLKIGLDFSLLAEIQFAQSLNFHFIFAGPEMQLHYG